ncbi:MAG TPA: hypothetical protein VMV50_00250 [Candidatus Paceibacterota bacterium]|nr:hypothetical protein [Candidatus Paceibacterota bacterium]
MRHHAFVIEAEAEAGIAAARDWLARELGLAGRNNPDIVEFVYGLFSVEDARRVGAFAAQAPVAGEHKALVIAAGRAYHEAQNALLKLFEEPPEGTYLFLILPSLGGLLPTMRSRAAVLAGEHAPAPAVSEAARAFLAANAEKRSAVAKRLASGKDDDERRAHRDEALAIVNGIEAAAYARLHGKASAPVVALLKDVQAVRGYLHDRSAPVRLVLEHLALVAPKDLV